MQNPYESPDEIIDPVPGTSTEEYLKSGLSGEEIDFLNQIANFVLEEHRKGTTNPYIIQALMEKKISYKGATYIVEYVIAASDDYEEAENFVGYHLKMMLLGLASFVIAIMVAIQRGSLYLAPTAIGIYYFFRGYDEWRKTRSIPKALSSLFPSNIPAEDLLALLRLCKEHKT